MVEQDDDEQDVDAVKIYVRIFIIMWIFIIIGIVALKIASVILT